MTASMVSEGGGAPAGGQSGGVENPERAPEELLAGSVAIVTGAGRGIGRGIALEMVRAGADVVLLSRTLTELEAVAAEIRALGRRALPVVADVRDAAQVVAAVKKAWEAFPSLDILVNNAGLLMFSKFWEYDEATYRDIIDTNLTGPFLLCQVVADYWISRGTPGRIINIASVETEVAYPDQAPYAASKGGLLTLTKVLAKELGPAGIRVAALGPGPIDTPMSQRFKAQSEVGVVFGRLGQTSEVGQAAVFLASQMASFVTGTIVYVDGGYLLR